MAALARDDLQRLIVRIQQGEESGWPEFVDRFAPLLLQAARSIERDRDAAADAFVFICERLRERRGARLASFDFSREGSFDTWLRAVAINLARDARRHRIGRFRPLALSRRLPPLEQQVFRLRYELGFTFEQILYSLQPEFPDLTGARLAEADALVSRRVSAQQRWTLLTRRPRVESFSDVSPFDSEAPQEPAADAPDPEWLAIAHDARQRLSEALRTLTVEDRLLVRLHLERRVTLARLAPMFGQSNAQAVHRRLQNIFARLRRVLEGKCEKDGSCP